MISLEDYLGQHGAGHEAELTDVMRTNAGVIIERANAMLVDFGEDRALRSGWRPQAVNDATPNAARASRHISCQGIDIADEDGRLKAWITPQILERFGLYMEFGKATPTWVHVQCVAPGSGKRILFPNATWAARAENGTA